MKHRQSIHIAVADTSVIIRTGLLAVLKRVPDINIETIEVTSLSSLDNCMLAHRPDIVIVNPNFEGWFNVEAFRLSWPMAQVKIVALLTYITDANLLKDYDQSITLFDDIATISRKLVELMHISQEESDASEQEALSQREKEIICLVVKGMTNKEIADQLFLSIHTVMTHRRNIARKLQIHSPSGLTIYAIVNRLVDISDIKIGG